ncbi:MAG: NUDIX domain-containing protein [Bacteroidales bacterium]|nr:NUDIX domain-containing protein [Bacteroidales bacterium]
MKVSYKYHTFCVPLWLLRCLKRRMRWVRAAGGIITDESGQMLLILRNGRWDLPKGKVEAGETLRQAALREVEEETGVTPLLTIHYPLPTKTYHVFNLYGGWHLKQTSWFAMTARRQPAAPQQEEGITEVVWVSPDEWHRRLQHSYGTLKTLSRQWINSTR